MELFLNDEPFKNLFCQDDVDAYASVLSLADSTASSSSPHPLWSVLTTYPLIEKHAAYNESFRKYDFKPSYVHPRDISKKLTLVLDDKTRQVLFGRSSYAGSSYVSFIAKDHIFYFSYDDETTGDKVIDKTVFDLCAGAGRLSPQQLLARLFDAQTDSFFKRLTAGKIYGDKLVNLTRAEELARLVLLSHLPQYSREGFKVFFTGKDFVTDKKQLSDQERRILACYNAEGILKIVKKEHFPASVLHSADFPTLSTLALFSRNLVARNLLFTFVEKLRQKLQDIALPRLLFFLLENSKVPLGPTLNERRCLKDLLLGKYQPFEDLHFSSEHQDFFMVLENVSGFQCFYMGGGAVGLFFVDHHLNFTENKLVRDMITKNEVDLLYSELNMDNRLERILFQKLVTLFLSNKSKRYALFRKQVENTGILQFVSSVYGCIETKAFLCVEKEDYSSLYDVFEKNIFLGNNKNFDMRADLQKTDYAGSFSSDEFDLYVKKGKIAIVVSRVPNITVERLAEENVKKWLSRNNLGLLCFNELLLLCFCQHSEQFSIKYYKEENLPHLETLFSKTFFQTIKEIKTSGYSLQLLWFIQQVSLFALQMNKKSFLLDISHHFPSNESSFFTDLLKRKQASVTTHPNHSHYGSVVLSQSAFDNIFGTR